MATTPRGDQPASRPEAEGASVPASAAADAAAPGASAASAAPSLADFVAEVSGDAAIRVEESYGDGFVRLRVGEAERRQAKHDIRCVEDIVIEILRNSRDAGASRIIVATTRDGDMRTLVVLDDGSGVPDSMRERIFDARVTSKLDSVHMDRWGVHGRGMALFSIKENARSARVMASGPNLGSSIRVDVDATALPERKDQSTWPTIGRGDEGEPVLRGPHNIVRTCCEFALEERSSCDVYLGSPAEALATMRALAQAAPDGSRLLFVDDPARAAVCDRPGIAGDARELAAIASSLGLDISERTAHRVLASQVRALRPVTARLQHHAGAPGPREVDLMRDRRGLKLSPADSEQFSRIMERDFDYIAERYYLSLASEPRVHVSHDRISVTFDLEKHD